MKEIRYNIRESVSYYILISMVWCHDYLLQYIRIVLSKIPYIGQLSEYIIPIIYGFTILLSIKELKVFVGDFFLLFFIVTMYFLSPVVHPNTGDYWSSQYLTFLGLVLPFYLLGNYIIQKNTIDRMLNILFILSNVTIVLKLSYFLGFDSSERIWTAGGDMDTAYKLLPHICLVVYYSFKKTAPWNTIISVISIIYLLLLGTRGALLILLICVTIMYLMINKSKNKIWIVTGVVCIVLVVIYTPLFYIIIDWLEKLSSQLGMSVRIFQKLKLGTLGDLSNRDMHAKTIHEALSVVPFSGLGIYGDRVLNGSYAHSILVELWADFGYVIGSILIIVIVYVLVKAFYVTKSVNERAFLVIVMSNGLFKLFFSGSYITENMFFLMLGICMAIIRKSKCKAVIDVV